VALRFKLLLFLALAGSFLIFVPRAAQAKSYSITADVFQIRINPDKSITVDEKLTYDFSGSFSWAEMWIPTQVKRQGYNYYTQITDFNVSASDNSPVTIAQERDESDRYYVKWNYTAQDESKTFLISYKVLNAIKKYPDIAELKS